MEATEQQPMTSAITSFSVGLNTEPSNIILGATKGASIVIIVLVHDPVSCARTDVEKDDDDDDDEYKTAARQRLENLMVLCFLFPDRSKIPMAQREFSVATIVTRPKKREEPVKNESWIIIFYILVCTSGLQPPSKVLPYVRHIDQYDEETRMGFEFDSFD